MEGDELGDDRRKRRRGGERGYGDEAGRAIGKGLVMDKMYEVDETKLRAKV